MKLRAAALAVAALALAGCASQAANRHSTPQEPAAVVHARPVTLEAAGCARPTPTTAAGFTKLFASLPPAQWGAADVSISVPLADGRSVWLYGDTFSIGRFVHSTAITQDKGCLHVSHAGAQLIPNQDAHHIYWIETAIPLDSALGREFGYPAARLWIETRAITLTGTCPWCFKDGGRSRWAFASVDATGDVTFLGWQKDPADCCDKTYPYPAGGKSPADQQITMIGPHHFTYAYEPHPEFKLVGGRALVTTCQNWDDGVLHPMASYRPIFTASR